MIKKLTANARKPSGIWGRLMIKKMNATHYDMTVWSLNNINLPKDGAIADIGCGGGRCVRILNKMSEAEIFGVDYSPLCVSEALKKNKGSVKNGKVKILQASVYKLPFDDCSIDCAVSVEAVYFWDEPDKAFCEIKRALKPGGSLNIVCEMVKNDDGTGSHDEVADFLKLKYYSITELKELFERNGYKSINTLYDEINTRMLVSGIKPE